MKSRALWVSLVALAGWSCGSGESAGENVGANDARSAAESPRDDAAGEYSRESFVLCEAIEEYREELADIIGIEPDLERRVQGIGSQCHVRGTDFGFISVEIAPAITPSIAAHAGGFDAETTPVPSLGDAAVFVDASFQPHVVFELGDLIIDVGAEAAKMPGRDAMIDLATRVREILVAANS